MIEMKDMVGTDERQPQPTSFHGHQKHVRLLLVFE